MPAARSRPAAPPKPVSQATTYAQRQQREGLIRLGAALAPVLVFVIPALPSPIAGYDWKTVAWRAFQPQLMLPFPPAGTTPFPPQPLLQWLYWGVAVAAVWFIAALIQHLISLYLQRTRPLTHDRTYLRVRTPLNVALKRDNSERLMRTIHGMLPPSNLRRGDGAPLALRWTGRPERAVVQGVSVQGPETLVKALEQALKGVSAGTEVDTQPDPLLAELRPGRYVCWSDVRLAASDALALAIPPGGAGPLVDHLIQTLAPQTGCFAGDVQVMLRPVGDRAWRTRVLALLERLKVDAGNPEKRVMELKAAGPAFDYHVRLIVVAATPQSGQTMVTTMGAALAASAQSMASAQQRLIAGAVHVAPAVIPPVPALPARTARRSWLAGAVLALALWGAIGVMARSYASGASGPWFSPAIWALPVPFMALPRTMMGARWRKAHQADLPDRLQTVLKSVMPLRNPRIVPLWSEWFGHLS